MTRLISFPKPKTELGLVFVLFIFAVLFRLWFISLSPQPFWWDQEEYERYTAKMMDAPFYLAPHTYRSYPYPLFLALVYTVVGFGNHQAIFFLQAWLDAGTGILVYLILKRVGENRIIPWIGLILYSVNPFTSGYAGLVLTEVPSAFLITAAVYAGVRFVEKFSLRSGVILGLTAGLVAQIKNAAFIWAIIPIAGTLLFLNFRKFLLPYLFVAIGLGITVVYPLYVNNRYYGELTVTTVDSITARELYNGAVLKILPPFTRWYPPEIHQMYVEYYSEYYPQRTKDDRKKMAQVYMKKAIDLIKSDPWDYLRWRFYKMWYVWQKENIFFIVEPGYENHKHLTYRANLVLLSLALVGLLAGWKLTARKSWRFALLAISGTVLYGTLAFSLTHAEYRLTIPFYPLLYIAAAAGGYSVIDFAGRFLSKLSRK